MSSRPGIFTFIAKHLREPRSLLRQNQKKLGFLNIWSSCNFAQQHHNFFSTSSMAPSAKHYDLIVLGGGSGGLAMARRASSVYGVKAAVVEGGRLGGTCVNVGCVPKKVMWYASSVAATLEDAKGYSFDVDPSAARSFDWSSFKIKRDSYIKRLNGIYERNLKNDNVDYIRGWASFTENEGVEVEAPDGSTSYYTCDKYLIATGGHPIIPSEDVIPGAKYGTDSDGFFELEQQPKRVALVGAGYIGCELSGMFHRLGSETHFFIRGETVLRSFDDMIQEVITDQYIKDGINIHKKSKLTKVEKLPSGQLKLVYRNADGGESTLEVDQLIWAIGRVPHVHRLQLQKVGLKQDSKGQVVADEYQNTNVPNIYSLGDVVGRIELTPVAIAAGRRLADRLYGGPKFAKRHLDYQNVPSAVFSHPEVGSIGLTEKQAKEKYGVENVKVYSTKFVAMYYAVLEHKEPTAYKLIVTGPEEKVVGLHLVGDASSEILQGFGVAIKMGATKTDFDECVAIHPTSAEELVTMK